MQQYYNLNSNPLKFVTVPYVAAYLAYNALIFGETAIETALDRQQTKK
jgi:hypothetical protein